MFNKAMLEKNMNISLTKNTPFKSKSWFVTNNTFTATKHL